MVTHKSHRNASGGNRLVGRQASRAEINVVNEKSTEQTRAVLNRYDV
jgi:hypothetical protein